MPTIRPRKLAERIAESRKDRDHDPETDLPSELVGGFEEYTWLYRESWSPQIERWFFSNVPTVMIFDDHEMIDDWNISDAWLRGIRQKDWWEDHVIGGLMGYWLYQHLGNLSPADIRAEGLLEALGQVADGEERLREWAMGAEEFTPTEGNYRFSFVRDIGRIRLVMIDSRNARVLEPRNRRMVNEDEWGWVVEACSVDVDHLLIGTSLPVFVPGGLHDLQEWSEAICDGAWGRPGRKFGEWLRVKADMEDWSAFSRSFGTFVQLLCDLGARSRDGSSGNDLGAGGRHPFSFAAEIGFPDQHDVASRVPPAGELADPQRVEAAREHGDAHRRVAVRKGHRTRLAPRAVVDDRPCRGESISDRCSPTVSARSTSTGELRDSASCKLIRTKKQSNQGSTR